MLLLYWKHVLAAIFVVFILTMPGFVNPFTTMTLKRKLNLDHTQTRILKFCQREVSIVFDSFDHPDKTDAEICGCVAQKIKVDPGFAPYLTSGMDNYDFYKERSIKKHITSAHYLADDILAQPNSKKIKNALRSHTSSFKRQYESLQKSCFGSIHYS